MENSTNKIPGFAEQISSTIETNSNGTDVLNYNNLDSSTGTPLNQLSPSSEYILGRLEGDVKRLKKELDNLKEKNRQLENKLNEKFDEFSNGKKEIEEKYNKISKPRESFYSTARILYIFTAITFFASSIAIIYINFSVLKDFFESHLVKSFLHYVFAFIISVGPISIALSFIKNFFITKSELKNEASD